MSHPDNPIPRLIATPNPSGEFFFVKSHTGQSPLMACIPGDRGRMTYRYVLHATPQAKEWDGAMNGGHDVVCITRENEPSEAGYAVIRVQGRTRATRIPNTGGMYGIRCQITPTIGDRFTAWLTIGNEDTWSHEQVIEYLRAAMYAVDHRGNPIRLERP